MSQQPSSSFGAFGGALSLIAAALTAGPSLAQDGGAPCPPGGFDVCFPDLDSGMPSAACGVAEEDAGAVAACVADVCASEAAEPQPGFFGYCCAAGGSVRYDEFCVLVVQTACPAVAEQCVDRCPPLELLTGTVSLSPPPSACVESYPPFIASVCAADPFCCTTSWDAICAAAAVEASVAP